ncbi:pentatricopeptide repeat-containing protein At3g62890-like isoform X2 [Phalaenopsis equestris]|uniref:pentatricopeptide repeat-containing protein At3g62890-like isoform X2 n=1 Tax=Phalaenopsis equestris TaxID=78828 RepID=UPI0009E26251|nr:pentatricopeptide repeat-containing protein At3g62890-like isoform X2 [Phalaenopsis equestris]
MVMGSTHPSLHLCHPTPDIFTWNSLLRSHPNPISLYPRILRHCTRPDSFTFPLLLSSLSLTSPHLLPSLLPQLHSHILHHGLFHHPHVLSSLISSYSSLPSHLPLFLSLPLPLHDLPTSNSLLSSLLRARHLLLARNLFHQMPRRNVISWSSIIHGHANLGHPLVALSLFNDMLADPRAPSPNHFTLSSVLAACARLGALHHGLWAHAFISRCGLAINAILATSLIDMYAKCGHLQRARKVFDDLPHQLRDATAWTAMISGLAVHGLAEDALSMFRDMVRSPSLKPNSVTLLAVLQACVHGGRVQEGEQYFAAMSPDFGIAPSIEHFGCMIDLYARVGLIGRALSTVQSMPMRPDALIWGALLGGSKTHGDILACEAAIKGLIEIEPGNSAAYLLLSNVYAKMGRWEEFYSTRRLMERNGVKKTPGCSSIEVDGRIHEFFSGYVSDPEDEALCLMVEEMMGRLRGVGTREVLLDLEGGGGREGDGAIGARREAGGGFRSDEDETGDGDYSGEEPEDLCGLS